MSLCEEVGLMQDKREQLGCSILILEIQLPSADVRGDPGESWQLQPVQGRDFDPALV